MIALRRARSRAAAQEPPSSEDRAGGRTPVFWALGGCPRQLAAPCSGAAPDTAQARDASVLPAPCPRSAAHYRIAQARQPQRTPAARLVDRERVGDELDQRGAVGRDQDLVWSQLQRQARLGKDVGERADQLRRQQLLRARPLPQRPPPHGRGRVSRRCRARSWAARAGLPMQAGQCVDW